MTEYKYIMNLEPLGRALWAKSNTKSFDELSNVRVFTDYKFGYSEHLSLEAVFSDVDDILSDDLKTQNIKADVLTIRPIEFGYHFHNGETDVYDAAADDWFEEEVWESVPDLQVVALLKADSNHYKLTLGSMNDRYRSKDEDVKSVITEISSDEFSKLQKNICESSDSDCVDEFNCRHEDTEGQHFDYSENVEEEDW
jgi:hypothetical protein